MTTFIDTSAFLATLDRADRTHVMRRRAIPTAFAFDRHFADQGFRVIPQA